MEALKSNSKKIGRRRELNIIYFVDSSSTRTLRMPIERARLIVVALCSVALWALISVFIIGSMMSTQQTLESRISRLLTSIFDYQAQYDQAYEMAYPSKENKSPENAPQVVEATTAPSQLTLAAKALEQKPSTDLPSSKPVSRSTEEIVAEEIKVEIEEPGFRETSEKLSMDFAIKNTRGSDRASGLVYAIARLRLENGSDVFVAQPSTIEVDSTGYPRRPKYATPFTIRRFKPVTVEFDKPQKGTFVDVRIVISDDLNKKQEYQYNILKENGSEPSPKGASLSEPTNL